MKTYTIKELEPILKRKEKTIKSFIKKKILNASFYNNVYVITEKDVEDFLNSTSTCDIDD